MKKIISLATGCLILMFDISFGQIEVEWQKCIGGTADEFAFDIRQTSDGGYVIAGESTSNDGDVSGNYGGHDAWVVKTDGNGNIQWQNCLGGTNYDYANSIQQTTDGGFIVMGATNSNDIDVSGNHGGWDCWIVKLNNGGNIQWQKCFGGSLNDYAYSVQQNTDSGYIFSGVTYSNDGDVTGNHGDSDFWVVKLDASGNILWQNCFGGSNEDVSYSVDQTNDGGYITAGLTSSNDSNVSGNHGSYDYWVVKIDSSGSIQWQKCLGGTSQEWAYFIRQTPDFGYCLAGWTESNDGDASGNHGGDDYWVLKLDSIGNIQWQKCLGGTFNDQASSVLPTSDNGYLVTGFPLSNDGDIVNSIKPEDYWIVKLDSIGNIIWQKSFGGIDHEMAYAIRSSNEEGCILAGHTRSINCDITDNHGMWDYWIIKVTENYNSINGRIFIDANNNLVYDSGEKIVKNHRVSELNTGKFSFSNDSGIYYLNIVDTGNFSTLPASINYYTAVPPSYNIYFSGVNQSDSLNDFAFQPTGIINDLCVTLTPLGVFRAGFDASYMISYENIGTTTLNPTVILFTDNDVTFVSAIPAASLTTMDSVVWNFGPLVPFQTGSILVTVHVTVGTPVGTLINSLVRIEPVAGDANTACNYSAWEVYAMGSYDPNEILVDEDTVFTTQLANPPYLEYIIYFQNTGNDTAFNIRLLNNLPIELDVTTFEFVASSHTMNITYGAHARLMTFTFDNILLPDSNVNEPASHGFIRYRIKPKSTLVAGDLINNTAFIYFDFNQPVMTNTAVTEIVLPTGVSSQWSVGSGQLTVYPNPAQQSITIFSSLMTNDQCQMTIYDLFGREVYKSTIYNLQSAIKINVSGFSRGIYFVELQSGEQVLRGKFLKE